MCLTDVVSITFVCVAANHLGLVAAIQERLHTNIPVVNCPKCLAFWLVLICELCNCNDVTIPTVFKLTAVSFIAAWAAIWMDLAMGAIDKLYLQAYVTIYPTTSSADASADDTADAMSDMQPDSSDTAAA